MGQLTFDFSKNTKIKKMAKRKSGLATAKTRLSRAKAAYKKGTKGSGAALDRAIVHYASTRCSTGVLGTPKKRKSAKRKPAKRATRRKRA